MYTTKESQNEQDKIVSGGVYELQLPSAKALVIVISNEDNETYTSLNPVTAVSCSTVQKGMFYIPFLLSGDELMYANATYPKIYRYFWFRNNAKKIDQISPEFVELLNNVIARKFLNEPDYYAGIIEEIMRHNTVIKDLTGKNVRTTKMNITTKPKVGEKSLIGKSRAKKIHVEKLIEVFQELFDTKDINEELEAGIFENGNKINMGNIKYVLSHPQRIPLEIRARYIKDFPRYVRDWGMYELLFYLTNISLEGYNPMTKALGAASGQVSMRTKGVTKELLRRGCDFYDLDSIRKYFSTAKSKLEIPDEIPTRNVPTYIYSPKTWSKEQLIRYCADIEKYDPQVVCEMYHLETPLSLKVTDEIYRELLSKMSH